MSGSPSGLREPGKAPPAARRSWGDAFNVVMATGIVSIAAYKFGLEVISLVLLGVALLAFVPLAAIDALRARRALLLLRRARAPRSGLPAMGFVAATAVLGTRLVILGGESARVIAIVLLVVGALVWVPILASVLPTLTRALMGSRQIAPARGEWLLGVVSTEGLAVLLGALAGGHPSALRYAVAVLWVLGGLLYLAIFWLLAERVRRHSLSPQEFTPDLWIVMGAPAIVSLAGATAFHGSTGSPAGVTVIVSWALASALMPVILAGELWRARRLGPPRFAPERWTMVFPLGMYSVAGTAAGKSFHVAWIAHVGHWFFPIALAAWALVAAGELRAAFRGRGEHRPAGAAVTGSGD